MTITATSTLRDVAFIVCSAFAAEDILIVLTGGSAATVYAPDAYQSRDIDFVIQFAATALDIRIISTLGFRPTTSAGVYEHPNVGFTLEFIDGPLAVGREVLNSWSTLVEGDLSLNILTPTDCVCDRLSAAIHWRDRSSLAQAAHVARRQPVDLERIKQWCLREGGGAVFEDFNAMVG